MRYVRRAWPFLGILATCAVLRVLLDAPQSETAALIVAILVALPWSLCLLLVTPGPGFSEFAAWCVSGGIGLNLLLAWGVVAWLARQRRRDAYRVR